jgi:A/G-specific adenine glycosylase
MLTPMEFARQIIEWQRHHGRHDLPWQGTRDPYRIWLSEVMLQQTQVATVIPYYRRFVERYPDVSALAAAPIDEVMEAWAGLGYYSRARNLHRCAQAVVAIHGGVFPRSALELGQLPGIGRSTAAAIAAFAYGERAAILDGNVKRVLARHFGVEDRQGAAAERALWKRAEAQLPQTGIEVYTQGLMDLGATICLRRRPCCDVCPVRSSCFAVRENRVDVLPPPRPARTRPLREAALALIADGRGAILLERRAPAGVWGALLSPPEFDPRLADDALIAEVGNRFGLRAEVVQHLGAVRHEFSHYSFVMHPRLMRAAGATRLAESSGLVWLSADAVDRAALPAPIRRLLRGVLVRSPEGTT